MIIKRELKKDGTVCLYLAEESYNPEKKKGEITKKKGAPKILKALGTEQPVQAQAFTEERAVVWAEGRTLGNVVPFSDNIIGKFPEAEFGIGVILPCDIVRAGKFRNGAERWWCRTHQVHWGTKADLQAALKSTKEGICCSNADQPMHYTKNPLILDPIDYPGGVGIWAALPSAINTTNEPDLTEVLVHVHTRKNPSGSKTLDCNFPAVVVVDPGTLLLDSETRTRVIIAPPAALAYLEAIINQRPLDTLLCRYCSHPHLDLGDFAKNPHRKHFCANCGYDTNWSKEPIVSNPLKLLSDSLTLNPEFVTSDRTLNLRDYDGCSVKIWASTPAVLWTSPLPQVTGIHVHIYQGEKKVLDDTFGQVTGLDGSSLEREKLLATMLEKVGC